MGTEALNATKIIEHLHDCGHYNIVVLDSIDSTNDYLMARVASEDCNVVLAEKQTAGRGRLGDRVWNSPSGNLYFSMHKVVHGDIQKLYGLSLVIGIAVARMLKNEELEDVQLKWPNDIYWHGKKLGGILVETKQSANKVDVVIGIGINITDPTDEKFVCLNQALGKEVSRNKLTAELIKSCDEVFNQLIQYGFDTFKDEWNSYCLPDGEAISSLKEHEVIDVIGAV